MPIPIEPIYSIPRPPELIHGLEEFAQGKLSPEKLAALQEKVLDEIIARGNR